MLNDAAPQDVQAQASPSRARYTAADRVLPADDSVHAVGFAVGMPVEAGVGTDLAPGCGPQPSPLQRTWQQSTACAKLGPALAFPVTLMCMSFYSPADLGLPDVPALRQRLEKEQQCLSDNMPLFDICNPSGTRTL